MSEDAITIYHNPRCTKSRETLALLRGKGIEPTVVEYLESPQDEATLLGVLAKLGLKAIDIIRRGEAIYGELDLKAVEGDEDALIRAMVEHPILMERPIVVRGDQARIGRPPEAVLEIV